MGMFAIGLEIELHWDVEGPVVQGESVVVKRLLMRIADSAKI